MNSNNAIYIVGAGAIGKVLATFLKRANKNVTTLRGSVDEGSSHAEEISVEVKDDAVLKAEIGVSTLSDYSVLNGLVVLTSKSYGNTRLAETLKTKIGHSPLVILQNGLNVEQPFLDNSFAQVYRCVLFATSQPIAENKYRFKPVAVSPIGTIKGEEKILSNVVAQLTTEHFPFQAEANIQPVIWTKAIVNSVFNSVCSLLETDNGIFYRNEKALAIAKGIIQECIAVARASGITLDKENVIDRLLLISKASDGQLISTYQDILSKRRTEIETLNLAIARVAKSLNREEAVKETALLGELIRLKSELMQQDFFSQTLP